MNDDAVGTATGPVVVLLDRIVLEDMGDVDIESVADAEVGISGSVLYKLSRLGPPQYSLLFPPHIIEQPFGVSTAPSLMELAQKHSVEYSTPI